MVFRNLLSASTLAGVVSALSVLISPASATMISGVVNTTGVVGVSATTFDFYTIPAGQPGAGGNFQVGLPATGNFTGQQFTTGTAKDLVGPPFSQAVPAFMTFANGVVFDLTSIPNGGGTNAACSGAAATAVNSICTPTGSPFTLINGNTTDPNTGQANTVTITLVTFVNGYTGTAASGTTAYTGTFSTQLSGSNIASVIAILNSGQSVVSTISASFTPAVPEPASMLFLGSGLLGLGALARRRRAQSK